MNGPTFVRGTDAPWVAMGAGVKRQVLGYGPDLMLVRLEFDAGVIGAVHHHPHRQVTYVASGAFDVTVDGETARLVAGDSFFVRESLVHGVVAIDGGTLLDVFTPAREEFVR